MMVLGHLVFHLETMHDLTEVLGFFIKNLGAGMQIHLIGYLLIKRKKIFLLFLDEIMLPVNYLVGNQAKDRLMVLW